jgi:hypothetical protein
MSFCLSAVAQAEPQSGRRHHVKNNALSFDAVELRIDGVFVGFVDADSKPIHFSKSEYAFALCPVNKASGEADGYCLDWRMFDVKTKISQPLDLLGLAFSSVPAFHWPYIAYVRVPEKITPEHFSKGLVKVSCVVVEWLGKKVVAQREVEVNVGHFETDAPGSFPPPRFTQTQGSYQVSCFEYNGTVDGNVISTIQVPR